MLSSDRKNRPPSRSSSQGPADLMVEVDEDQNDDDDEETAERHVDFDDKIPGEDDEPDMNGVGQEEQLIPLKPRAHGGLFGADLSSVKF